MSATLAASASWHGICSLFVPQGSPKLKSKRQLKPNMAKKIQSYPSIAAFRETHNICLPRPHDWRLIAEPVTGEINGIARMRGFAVATNGILVVLETEQLDLAIGHLDWFVPDAEELQTSTVPKRTAIRRQVMLAEYD